MNKDSNYIKLCRNTVIITIIFIIVSFCAILCIQKVIDSGKYKGVDAFEINKPTTQDDDGDVKYVVTKNKDIFENRYYDNKKIAPGVSGTYEFDVINNRKSKVKYKIDTSNTNSSNINLKYRLKRDNEYVIGNESTWVSISGLNLTNVLLNSKSTHSYILEWKWPYEDGIDNIDTQIGKDGNSKYELNISVYAEEV
jgi:hypothetical protein